MADILCPNCSMPNPDDQNICSFCRQPLHIASDDDAIRPGDMPTKKNTSELEPILPQWLKDARTRARQDAADDQAEQAAAEAAKPAVEEPSAPDWLAGLEAAAKEESEEYIPDWMRGMTPSKPAAPAPKREQPAKEEPKTFTRRQEISWEDEQPAPAPRPTEPPPTGPLGATQSEDGIPYWLKNLDEESPAEKKEVDNFFAQKEEPTPQGNVSPFESGTFRPNTGELINWLDKMSPQVGETAPSMPSPDVPASEPLPDWVSRLEGGPAEAAPTAPAGNEFNFDWLKEESSKPFTPFQPSQMGQESPPAEEPNETPAELPDWMTPSAGSSQQPLNFGSLETPDESAATPQGEPEEAPDWLNNMSAGEIPSTAPAQADLPDWMRSAAETLPAEQPQPSSGIPDWMKTFAPESSPAETPASTPEASSLPDWIQPMPQDSASRMEEAGAFDWITPESASQPAAEQPSASKNVPAFVSGDDTLNTGDIFAAEMPDWLSGIAPTETKSTIANLPKAETPSGESISPAELPSWVQAMRPVEAALPGTPATREPTTGPAESQGPLAGLRGVLPDMPGLATSGKPKIYSIRLEPTADQQQHAALLEQMLEAETQAKPMRAGSFMLGSQRVLRWIVTLLLVGLISFVVFAGLQVTPLPAALSPEGALILPVLDAVPNDAPVLLVFDYEPALAGELEATAASFLDRLTTLRNPQYSVISTSPTGAALAERFFKKSNLIQSERIKNLGYLPGESSGILSFALHPSGVESVNAFSDYALVILLTDRAESARAWVEQTTDYRNGRPLVVVSSAQAAPMIQPYLISGQVNGLLSGLRDGAAFEGLSGQAGAARRYWDAYNLSLIVVVILIFFGGMWNLFAGLRARRQEQADA